MQIPPGYRRVEGTQRQPAAGARLVGPADPNETLSVSIYVRHRPGAPPLPDQQEWVASLPVQRKFLSRQEFAQQHGAAQADLDRLATFAVKHGLTVVETSVDRRVVIVSGTVDQMSRAFAVELGRYESATERYRGREGYVHLPNDVADVVEGVFGLDNRRVVHRTSNANPPPGASPLTPQQVGGLYGFPPWKATGQTIGILEFGGGYALGDIQQFFGGLNPPLVTPVITDVSIDGATNAPAGNIQNVTFTDPDLEVVLDIDVAGSVAQGAKIAVYFAPNSEQGLVDAVTAAIHDATNAPSVLSDSWGGSELNSWTLSGINTISGAFQEAAALGITIFAASGDQGSDCTVGDGNAHVLYPASDPWVTSCGGTFIANVLGSVFTEGTWNDPGGATGGGISDIFALPSWQTGVGVPLSKNPGSRQGRGVPDIAGNASPFSGYVLILYGQPTTSLIITSGKGAGNFLGPTGGASAVAPLYAGLIALLNADLGQPVGYLNPTLYAVGKTPGQKVFRDINDGANNQWLAEVEPTANPPPSYTSGLGWDACTGWGSISGKALLVALIQAEETKVIDPDNPFSFGNWLVAADGQTSGGNDVELGRKNRDNNGQSTVVNTACYQTAALAGDNPIDTGRPETRTHGVGVFGRSHQSDWSVGVAGESSKGCGVYGIATDENPTTHEESHGIGVVGRSVGGHALDDISVERIVGEPIGVLGQSTDGPGVRGHGGPLLTLSQEGPPLPPLKASPGGVFSSGQLQEANLGGANPELTSLDSLPQLRLVPSTGDHLPTVGQVGDFFLTSPNDVGVQLWICTKVVGTMPQWRRVHLDSSLPGGTAV